MGRPEESRLRVAGAGVAGGAVVEGSVYVGGGMGMAPAEVGMGVEATPAKVGGGEEEVADEMTQWATSVTEEKSLEPSSFV